MQQTIAELSAFLGRVVTEAEYQNLDGQDDGLGEFGETPEDLTLEGVSTGDWDEWKLP